MKTKKIFRLAALIGASFAMGSCIDMMDSAHDAAIVDPISVAVKVNAITGFVDAEGNGQIDPNFKPAGLNVRFVNYEEDAVIETTTDDNGIAVAEITPGNYTISVTGSVEFEGATYYLNGALQNKALMTDITPEQAAASKDFAMSIRPSQVGSLCFREIFYCGSPGYYFRNQFYEIYNNGDQVYYLDHLCFAQLHPNVATTSLPEWPAEDGQNNFVYGYVVWQFPGTGQDYPLYPGESVIIAQEAADHTKNQGGTGEYALMDNSKVEFEAWSGNPQRDNPDVPNLKYVYWSGRVNTLQWLTSVFGSAFCLYQPGRALSYEDTSYWKLGETTQHPVGSSTEYARIPAEQILDGVELIPTSTALNMKRIPGFVDAGAASVEAAYVNKSVCRKVIGYRDDGSPIYQDTNDSSADFEVMSPPMLRRNGEKMPAWSWSLNQ